MTTAKLVKTVNSCPKTSLNDKPVVMIPMELWETLQVQLLTRPVPTYYLQGKEAKQLDHLVQQGINAARSRKTRVITSLAELD
ncbi:MAG: hypothetical protein WCV88_04155 [Patescibacteria group bacterium]|jgi:hypothetical protein